MSPRSLALLLAVLGGVLLVVAGIWSFTTSEPGGVARGVEIAGFVVSLAALVALGYLLVAQAPIWLRLIVAVGLPLLAAAVWEAAEPAIEDQLTGWHGVAVARLVAGVVMLVGAGVSLRQVRTGRPAAPPHRH